MTRSSLGRTWHIVAFVVAVIALVLQLILILLGQNILDSSSVTSGLPEQVRRYFSYFTIQANLLVAISMFMLVTGRTETQLFRVLRLSGLVGITVVQMSRPALFMAGRAFRDYRRRGGTKAGVLPDFFIGAHAAVLAVPLITRDAARYRSYFPTVELVAPE